MVPRRGYASVFHLPQTCIILVCLATGLSGLLYSTPAADDQLGRFRSEGSPATAITLTWTAVGDDGSTGVATTYDLRYAPVLLSEENWESAIQVSAEPEPQPAGAMESVMVSGLTPNTTYYFGLKVADEVPNWSGLSNVVSLTTLPLAPVAGFECAGVSGGAPYSVEFHDLSTNDPTSWLWSFGDGAASVTQNPTHTFLTPGCYTISLVAENTGGADTLTAVDYINVYPDNDCAANCDIDVHGTRTATYLATHQSDNVCEIIEEVESQGRGKSRYSSLEHKWIIDVSTGTQVTFHLEAYHSDNTETDDFLFSYSLNDIDYTDLLTVSKTSDDDAIQSAVLPSSIQGPVYFRVTDTDCHPGNLIKDKIFIDRMFVTATGAPDGTPPVISNLVVQDVSSSAAVIRWDTDEHSTSVVHYDDSGGPVYDFVVSSAEPVQSHCLVLTDLSASTEYFFVVASADVSENQACSDENQFTTTSGIKEIVIADLVMELMRNGSFARAVATGVTTTRSGTPIADAEISVKWSGLTSSVDRVVSGDDGTFRTKSEPVGNASGLFALAVKDVVKGDMVFPCAVQALARDSIFADPNQYRSQPEPDLAGVVTLRGCYPNPGVSGTSIQYDLPEACRATMKIFDITGRPVHTLINSRLHTAGRHQIIWDRRDDNSVRLSNGVYFIQLTTGDATVQTRLALLD